MPLRLPRELAYLRSALPVCLRAATMEGFVAVTADPGNFPTILEDGCLARYHARD